MKIRILAFVGDDRDEKPRLVSSVKELYRLIGPLNPPPFRLFEVVGGDRRFVVLQNDSEILLGLAPELDWRGDVFSKEDIIKLMADYAQAEGRFLGTGILAFSLHSYEQQDKTWVLKGLLYNHIFDLEDLCMDEEFLSELAQVLDVSEVLPNSKCQGRI